MVLFDQICTKGPDKAGGTAESARFKDLFFPCERGCLIFLAGFTHWKPLTCSGGPALVFFLNI